VASALEDVEARLTEVERRARDAESTALSVESQVDDNLGEIQYLRDRTAQAEERVRDGLLDLQGINLEQRVEAVLLAKIQDGTITAVERERATLDVEESPIWNTPIAFDVVTSGNIVASGGTYPVLQSESSLSESESEDVATGYSTLSVPDEGADQSETDSPEQADENY
jgi:hypothetical protein